jgi:hypothetical protein
MISKFDELYGETPLRPQIVCRVVPMTWWERLVNWLDRLMFGEDEEKPDGI